MDIILKNIDKSYGEKKVLNKFNLRIKEGEITFFIGESGIGKTTVLNILLGIEKDFIGNIEGIKEKNISAVFQEDRLCENLSIKKNIELALENVKIKELEEVLKAIGLKCSVNEKIKNLSGGMKRRVAIVRALMYPFDFLILDEPFKGLDDENKEKTIKLLKEKSKGKTVIIVTHNKEEIKYFKNYELIELKS